MCMNHKTHEHSSQNAGNHLICSQPFLVRLLVTASFCFLFMQLLQLITPWDQHYLVLPVFIHFQVQQLHKIHYFSPTLCSSLYQRDVNAVWGASRLRKRQYLDFLRCAGLRMCWTLCVFQMLCISLQTFECQKFLMYVHTYVWWELSAVIITATHCSSF